MADVRGFVEMAHQVGGHATTKTSTGPPDVYTC
jgi:hypothetical protein